MYFESSRSFEPQGVLLVVYTRWDSDILKPEDMAVRFGHTDDVGIDNNRYPFVLELYNNTGFGFLGFSL